MKSHCDDELTVGLHETDEELVRKWKQSVANVKETKRLEEAAVGALAKRAKEKRSDFKDKFTVEGEHSRQVIIDGGKAGRVQVSNTAVFDVDENLGEEAKRELERWACSARGRYARELGVEKVESIELIAAVMAQVGDRKQKAKLTKSAATALRAIELPKHTSRTIREGIELVVKSLRPDKGKVSVKEVK